MTNPVMQALVNAKMREASVFGRWCITKGVQSLPASPAHVTAFVRECEPILPIDQIWRAVMEISHSHVSNGFADPTAGGPVSAAIKLDREHRSAAGLAKEEKGRFLDLPYDLQVFFAAHEGRREKEIRRAHNAAASAKQKLEELEQPITEQKTDGIEQNTAA